MAHQLIEYVAVTIFQVCTYIIFFLQAIFGSILIILGPLSFAFSILPGYRDAYLNWIARFISVGLYSVIGYLVLNMAIEVVRLGILQELAALNQVKDDPEAFVMYVATSRRLQFNPKRTQENLRFGQPNTRFGAANRYVGESRN